MVSIHRDRIFRSTMCVHIHGDDDDDEDVDDRVKIIVYFFETIEKKKKNFRHVKRLCKNVNAWFIIWVGTR